MISAVGGFGACAQRVQRRRVVGAADRVLETTALFRRPRDPVGRNSGGRTLGLSVHERLQIGASDHSGAVRCDGAAETRLTRALVDHAIDLGHRLAGVLEHPEVCPVSQVQRMDHDPEVAGHLLEGRDLTFRADRGHAFVEPCIGAQRAGDRDPRRADHLRGDGVTGMADEHQHRYPAAHGIGDLGRRMQVVGDSHRRRLAELKGHGRERVGRPRKRLDHELRRVVDHVQRIPIAAVGQVRPVLRPARPQAPFQVFERFPSRPLDHLIDGTRRLRVRQSPTA